MPYGKRKRVSSRVPISRAVATSMRVGNWRALASAGRSMYKRRMLNPIVSLQQQVSRINRTIETKENTRTVSNVAVAHNNIQVLNLNPFLFVGQGSGDPMDQNNGNRVGDSIHIKSLLVRAFLENSLARAKVHFRVMLIKCAKGDTIDRNTLYRNSSSNKMIDLINTERFTIIAQRRFTIDTSNNAASSLTIATGVPSGATAGGIGTRVLTMSIPGRRFGRKGIVQYENQSMSQVKFFDYRLVIACYDWYGTPQDINNVGFVNECFTKLYFKDA